MNSIDYLYLAKKDLLNFKLRSSLIILCIAIGIASSILNLYHTSKRAQEIVASFQDMGSQLISIHFQDEDISLKDLSFLSLYFPNLSYEISGQKKLRYLRKEKETLLIGITPLYQKVHSIKVERGRFVIHDDITKKRKICLVGISLADELKIKIGKTIKVGGDNLRIVGVFSEGILCSRGESQSDVLVPLSISQGIIETNRTKNLRVILQAEGDPSVLTKEVERILKGRFPQKKKTAKNLMTFDDNERFFVSSAEGLLEMIKQQRDIGRMIVLGIGIMTLILAGGGIVNLIMLSVRQRYKEIGIMRACGAREKDIFNLFLLEGMLLSIYGLGLGGGISFLYVVLFGECRLGIFLDSLFWSGLICLPLALCGYYPASCAAKISPCEAIRTQT